MGYVTFRSPCSSSSSNSSAGLSDCTVWGVGLDRSDTGIVGSNPTQGTDDVYPRLSVLC
jgi:hypothetical protein